VGGFALNVPSVIRLRAIFKLLFFVFVLFQILFQLSQFMWYPQLFSGKHLLNSILYIFTLFLSKTKI